MKNIVIIPAITPKNQDLNKFGGWGWMDISINAWKFWCEKNGYKLVIYDTPSIEDLSKFRVTVQRWFDIFDFLKNKNIEFDQAAIVDACSIPKWDCPDFFKVTNNKLTVRRDLDNLKWIHESVIGYKDIFDGFELDISKYFYTGFMVFNKSHEILFKKFKEKYMSQFEDFINLQKTVGRGTDQTPLNYITQINNTECTYIYPAYNVSHLTRKSLLSHNWQLKEDKTPFFIKYCYLWVFSGFDKTQRNSLMEQTWNIVKDNYK